MELIDIHIKFKKNELVSNRDLTEPIIIFAIDTICIYNLYQNLVTLLDVTKTQASIYKRVALLTEVISIEDPT